jgi:hypothetical protein
VPVWDLRSSADPARNETSVTVVTQWTDKGTKPASSRLLPPEIRENP